MNTSFFEQSNDRKTLFRREEPAILLIGKFVSAPAPQ
jgi:hypothetical protein